MTAVPTANGWRGALARRNPAAKLGAALLFSLPLIVTLDPVAPAVAIAVELAVLPLFGVHPLLLLRRAAPLLLSIAGLLVTVLLFAADRSGTVLLAAGPVTLTTGVLLTALGLSLRVVAVALPGLIVLATTDPTDLADALIQNARFSPRFAIGALAAFRLVPLLTDEWRTLAAARRARGVDAGRNPAAAVRIFASTAFALLVGAIRRGVRLATAMDARGFDSRTPRTVARRQTFGRRDAALLLAAAALSAGALAISALTGAFRPIF
ncbi:energy-coupling factor transporter transmembrane component T family protein [Catenuloplanes sp. NPDC051500]|uniref:energy-coupling factor transporter transmembrane component T family protein n=1 Tax=Catenuloplanes sp. NPDC051500 TaxID=3363959 RepID=UPI0037AD7D2B